MKAESSSAVMKHREKDEPLQPDGDVESHPMWCVRRDPSVSWGPDGSLVLNNPVMLVFNKADLSAE